MAQTRAYALSERGLARLDQRDFNGALADMTGAIRIAPNYAYSNYQRGWYYQRVSHFEESGRRLRRGDPA